MLHLEALHLSRPGFALDVSLHLPRGARAALIGPSGAGKSTVIELIAGFAQPDAGRIRIAGTDITDLDPAARPVSTLFQDGNLFPHLTVFDNVALGLRPNLRLNADERSDVEASLARVGLEGLGTRRPAMLSGGQRARVALARMALRNKPLALMDEPFVALDPGLRREMAGLVGEICAETGQTLVMVTHDLRGLETLLTDIYLIEAGRLTLTGPAPELLAHPPDALRPWL